MMIHEINAGPKAATRATKRRGRGESSGVGKTGGRGHKGSGQRAGRKHHSTHEGGQTPYFRRIPKRGFSNARFRVEYTPVNLDDLDSRFNSGDTVDIDALVSCGLISNKRELVKILGRGKLEKPLTVVVDRFSESAAEAIKAAGGDARQRK